MSENKKFVSLKEFFVPKCRLLETAWYRSQKSMRRLIKQQGIVVFTLYHVCSKKSTIWSNSCKKVILTPGGFERF